MNVEFYVPDTTIESYTVYMLVVPIILLLTFYFLDPFHIKDHYESYFDISVLIIIFSILSLYFLKFKYHPTKDSGGGEEAKQLVKKLTLSLGTLIGGFYLAVFLFKKISQLDNLFSILKFIGKMILLVGSLAVVFLALKTLKDSDNLIMKLIFYIPCLFIEFADYLKKEFKLTSSTVWIILGMELLVVLLMYGLPKLYQYIADRNSVVLLKKPVYLTKKYSLATFDELNKKVNKTMYKDRKYSYSISAWYYINPQPPNTSGAYVTWTPIINYTNKPVLEYYGLENTLRVRTEVPSDKDSNEENVLATVYSTSDIDFQKWNNIVFNYDGASLDIFSNGELVATHAHISPFMATDNIVLGTNNGIHGGICNVRYYTSALTKSDIKNTYNLLKTLNPPLL